MGTQVNVFPQLHAFKMSGLSQVRFFAGFLSCAFAAGAVGGVVNFLLPVAFRYAHIFSLTGVNIAPGFEKAELYHKIVWGGIWGLLFMFPLVRFVRYRLAAAAVYGLFPSLCMIFVVFPLQLHAGIGGIELGVLMPVYVLFFNTVGWSIPAYFWFSFVGTEEEEDYGYDSSLSCFHNPLLKS